MSGACHPSERHVPYLSTASASEPTREREDLPAATESPSNKNIAVRDSATACT